MKDVKITVDVKDSFKDEIRNKIDRDIYSFSNKLRINPTRLYEYFIWKRSQIPLKVLYKLSRLLNVPNVKLEKNIVSYKQLHVPSNNSIRNPNLPIQITPYFTSLLSNLFFDGSVPRDGKGTYYNQKNEQIMNDFIKKLVDVFGNVQYSLRKDHRGVLKCSLPRIVGEICGYAYGIRSFGTFDGKIPNNFFELNNNHKISFVLTGIIDEGSIAYDGSIIFGISNHKMINDFNRLCNELGLKTSGIKKRKNSNHYYICILSPNKLVKIIDSFNTRYPLISLRHKTERLKKALEIKNQKYFNTKKFADSRKYLLLNKLKQIDCSVNYLSNEFLIPPRTIRRYFYKLMEDKIIKRRKQGNEFIYSLN